MPPPMPKVSVATPRLAARHPRLAPAIRSVPNDSRPLLLSLAAAGTFEAKAKKRRPLEPVAHFHLGNGARLERVEWASADASAKVLREATGADGQLPLDLARRNRSRSFRQPGRGRSLTRYSALDPRFPPQLRPPRPAISSNLLHDLEAAFSADLSKIFIARPDGSS